MDTAQPQDNAQANALVPQGGDTSFRFLDLAQELRDLIYDECYGDIIKLPATIQEPDLQIERPTMLNLMRTCKQIKTEYQKRIGETSRTTLVIADHEFYLLHVPSSEQLNRFSTIRHVKVILFTRCNCFSGTNECRAGKETRRMNRLVADIQKKMPQLKTIAVHIGMVWSEGSSLEWPESMHDAGKYNPLQQRFQELSELENVCRVEVFKCANYTFALSQDTNLDDLWVSWTEEQGWKGPKK